MTVPHNDVEKKWEVGLPEWKVNQIDEVGYILIERHCFPIVGDVDQ
jgi:hypothetical protein